MRRTNNANGISRLATASRRLARNDEKFCSITTLLLLALLALAITLSACKAPLPSPPEKRVVTPHSADPGAAVPDPDAIAFVNGVAIPRGTYEAALRGLVQDRREPPSPADRDRILDRLIDEELMVQYGLSSGLAQRDHGVRVAVVRAVIEANKTFVCPGDCTRDDLRRYYAEHRDRFAPPDRLEVETLWFAAHGDDAGAMQKAHLARERLESGEALESVRRELASPDVAPPPAGPLPVDALARYIGPGAAAAAENAADARWCEPIPVPGGVRLVRVAHRETAEPPPFEQVESQVRLELERRGEETAVRALVEKLRAQAAITREGDTPETAHPASPSD